MKPRDAGPNEAKATDGKPRKPKGKRAQKKARPTLGQVLRAVAIGVAIVGGAGAAMWFGCTGWDPRKPFERNAPEVDQALRDMDGGQFASAADTLERYLGTGACGDAGIGLPASVREKPNGSYDLGLVLFSLAEHFGKRFGEEPPPGDKKGGDKQGADEAVDPRRAADIDCALILVKAIASDTSVPADLRARARYLAGNLEFMRGKYEEAVKLYDEALELVPGVIVDAGGDGVGRDAAWNRAIALLRLAEEKDAEPPDAGPPDASPPDGGDDAGDDAGQDGGNDAGQDGGGQDAGDDGGQGDGGPGDAGQDGKDGGKDDGKDAGGGDDSGAPQPQPKDQPPPKDSQQDERMLDRLEEAPTYQEQEAKARANARRGRTLEDK